MIPKLHYICKATTIDVHLDQIQKACSAGVELIQLDLKGIATSKQLDLAQEARSITSHFQTRLILKSDYKLARSIKADGVYLEKNEVCPTLARRHIYTWQTIGAAAYNLEDCETALHKNVDYISIGPYGTDILSGTKALSNDAYISIIEQLSTETPLIAFGAITTEDVKDILKTGISGLAISDAITVDFNSVKTFHDLLNASSAQEMRHSFK